MSFNTHLLSMEEVWFAREHPYDIKVVGVKKLVAEIEDMEDALKDKHDQLKVAVGEMTTRMKK